MKQVIIVRKDLNMGIGKMCGQVAHASMAFLSHMVQEHSKKQTINFFPAHNKNLAGQDIVMSYKHPDLMRLSIEAFADGKDGFYAKPINPNNPLAGFEPCDADYNFHCEMDIDRNLYEDWLGGIFTKIICEAKNLNSLNKAIHIATELGLKENRDYFLIKDCCLTELSPEEYDENGVGRTLTCVGFRPLPIDFANRISKKFQLLK